MRNEKDMIQTLSEAVENAAFSLHSMIGYIYSVGENDFYNINIKDLFKISLEDIGNPDSLSKIGISTKTDIANFTQLSDLMFYAFAVRTPYLRRISEIKVSDRLIVSLYESCAEKGAVDPDNFVRESFKANMKAAKISETKRSEPPFNGEWFRRWVYSYGGELAEITNRNMFLLGCMDALFPLYYAKLTDTLTGILR
ncbi:MAG: hypothetical protein FWH07_05850 [Oscillospiraceae bacterium]|nr:hypothetical protein [Oscillospiraceae bacterium]